MLLFRCLRRTLSTNAAEQLINENTFPKDNFTNTPERILQLLDRKLHLNKEHPLGLIKQRIVNYFHESFKGPRGNPIFSVHDQLSPVVTTYQNFDSLLVPPDHPSRSKSDTYYINKNYLLRSHMTAHQSELINMGLNSFLMIGDVYRRDEIDRCHFPAFHQVDGVRIFTPQELFLKEDDGHSVLPIMRTKAETERSKDCQEVYLLEASKRVEDNLKKTLEGLCKRLFGTNIVYRWVDAYFPFTHPSWELEIMYNDNWLEILGCGITEYDILKKAGCENRICWAFGLGLERLAMLLYEIPDIRIFWSKDSGFTSQFKGKSFDSQIKYKPVSVYPPCINHISFWIPDSYSSNDFYDLVRRIGSDLVEQVHLIDVFEKKEKNLTSHCYEIVYRHPERTITQKEVDEIHKLIAKEAAAIL
ncbi:UNVERIFIED_CONTAM: hypothetical protein PYX00_004256 [Menopon gallinae]|uniref:Phenylalanine--tRNA ligase, mitochondrial n=1 Tax=Menopon gallinae TaxID=328185 RepID=A0AAW2I3V8_9NEOP